MSHRRQWYAIRADLKRKGLWRYAEASTTKKARVAGKKRPAPEPDPEDPDEGTSTGTGSEAPPAKQPTLGERVQEVVSTIAGTSAGALRVISTGANIVGTFQGNQGLLQFAERAEATAKLLDDVAAAGGAGATTEDSAATAAAQVSNAPNQEDLAAAPAPQLAETTDPAGNTRPEVPETELDPSGGLQNTLVDELQDPQKFLEEVLASLGSSGQLSEEDEEELSQLLHHLEQQLAAPHSFVVTVGGDWPPFRVKQKSHFLREGMFAPV